MISGRQELGLKKEGGLSRYIIRVGRVRNGGERERVRKDDGGANYGGPFSFCHNFSARFFCNLDQPSLEHFNTEPCLV